MIFLIIQILKYHNRFPAQFTCIKFECHFDCSC